MSSPDATVAEDTRTELDDPALGDSSESKPDHDACPKAPEHLNSTGCYIKYVPGKGRGVFAAHPIRARTVVEISPVLLFSKEEYQSHGRFTVLDHYTFVWHDGRMALALGLGSIFNHSRTPNVSFSLDHETDSIRYTTAHAIAKDEELCIFYGHKLWFDDADGVNEAADTVTEGTGDGWRSLPHVDEEDREGVGALEEPAFLIGDPDEVVPESELPFTRLRLLNDEEEDVLEAVQLEKVWAVDIPDPRHTTTLLKWLQQSGLETPSLSHLKRIRRSKPSVPASVPTSTLLLTPVSSLPGPPPLPADIELPEPYVVEVPKSAALTQKALKVKSTFWPTIYAPRKKFEPEPWTRGRVRWAYDAVKTLLAEAEAVKKDGELPIVAYVPIPYDEETREATQITESFIAHDMRNSLHHPLKHAALNVVRQVADYRASPAPRLETAPVPTPPIDVPAPSSTAPEENNTTRNGLHYLLTGLTLFITHEPCIMCAMALLHSRVKEIFYLIPMEKTGGCGSVACVPKLPNVNHRYGIARWRTEAEGGGVGVEGVRIDESCDA